DRTIHATILVLRRIKDRCIVRCKVSARNAIQRTGKTARAKWLSAREREGLDPLLCQAGTSEPDPRRLSRQQGNPDGDMACYHESSGSSREALMIDMPYSLVIEATKDPMFFGFYSPDLRGFTGIG